MMVINIINMENTMNHYMIYDDVNDCRFKSINSLLCLIKLVYDYIKCTDKSPPFAYDVENKLIEYSYYLTVTHIN